MATKGPACFTLNELLVVTSIIGVLASIAIPQYASYRARSFDSKVMSAVRNAATGEEAYYATNQGYTGNTAQLPAMVPGDVDVPSSPAHSGGLAASFRVTGSH